MVIHKEKSTGLSALLELATQAARGAGERIVDAHKRSISITTKGVSEEPVSASDLVADDFIRSILLTARPDDGLVSEESKMVPSRGKLRWVIDPLDGTVNHVRSIPHFSVSIACEEAFEHGWRTVVAAVHDPLRNEIFTAVRGEAARLNGNLISTNDPVQIESALIATEFSYHAVSRARQGSTVARLLPQIKYLRSSGSSVLDLCWTAAGRFDGFFEDELEPWDMSAGTLIMEAAGGKVGAWKRGVIAAGPHLYTALRARVAMPE
jgi:myo-inositol-1(or 4)-monophosphatase